MFQIHKKPQGDAAVKKSVLKILDHKKDLATRLKHLKLVLELVTDQAEIQNIFEQYYSHIYYVFFENFLLAEANVRQKGAHRSQREELDSILQIFETILIRLPDLVHEGWQYNSIDHIIKKLIHPGNSLKIRRDGIRLFLLWFRALRDKARSTTVLLYASLVPGFPSPPTNNERYSGCTLESLLNPVPESQSGMAPAEVTSLVPPPAGEKTPPDLTKYFLDALLEYMVVEACKLQWKDGRSVDTLSFAFLWDMFKKFYLPHIFHDFHFDTSVYQPDLSLPEPREPVNYILNVTDTGTIDPFIEVAAGCPMLPARVSTIKWVVAFTSNALRNESKTKPGRSDIVLDGLSRLMQKHMQQQRQIVASVIGLPDKISGPEVEVRTSSVGSGTGSTSAQQEGEASHSNASTLTEKAPSLSSLSSLDDKLKSHSAASEEEELVRNILYSTRQNVNIVHEIFRQALMLPLTEATTMRRVIKVYQEWIQDGVLPVFMEEADLNASNNQILDEDQASGDDDDTPKDAHRKKSTTSTTSLRNTSYMRGQLNPLMDEALSANVRTGCQTTFQLFVTNAAHVFLVEPPTDASKLIQAQVDVCKRVLNLYRHMVMHVSMDTTTWTQLLQVLLHITRIMLQDTDIPTSIRAATVAGRLAGPVFQTLIVSWIKANLFVHVTRELWDELVDVLSSLMQWKDLIVEWARNMDTMTRVLARHVYGLELSDLPLDRLTEQKQKKNRKAALRERLGKSQERSFSKGWSRESIPPHSAKSQSRMRSRSAVGSVQASAASSADIKGVSVATSGRYRNRSPEVLQRSSSRGRSVTVLGIEPVAKNDPEFNDNSVVGELQDHGNHMPLKRGRSDNSSLSMSPTGLGLPDAFPGKPENLQRSSSTSDIACEKGDEIFPCEGEDDYSQSVRHRANSGPGFRGIEENAEDTVHGLKIPKEDDDGITSLSSVEDTFNDMFDELIQQRLSTVNPKPLLAEAKQPDVVSVKSQDSGSIDPNWNPWGESDSQSKDSAPDGSDSNQPPIFSENEEKSTAQYSDLKEEEDWQTCLEDASFGEENESEEHSSVPTDSSASSDDDYDFSSTTGTLTLSESCLIPFNLDVPCGSAEQESIKLDLFNTTVSPSSAPALEKSSPVIACKPSGLPLFSASRPLAHSYPLQTRSQPTTPSVSSPNGAVFKRLHHPILRRTKSYLTYRPRNLQPLSRHRSLRAVSRASSNPNLPRADLARELPLTRFACGAVEEAANPSTDSFNCPFKISRSMHCFPCFSIDGTLAPQLTEPQLTNSLEEPLVNERVSMLSKDQNTSSEATSPGMSSPPYQIYKDAARDRYDSTALLLPETKTSNSEAENRESIAEEDEGDDDSPDAILEKSSDDILGVHTSTSSALEGRRGSTGASDAHSVDESADGSTHQDKTDSILAPAEDCSILAGGRRTGWYPDVAVALWRRLLGILGDINTVKDPVIHQLIFTYLLKFWDVLLKMRENLGITTDNASTPPPPELVPPLHIMAPWAFKAIMSLPETHKGGRLHAYQLLCNTTLQHHDTRLEPEHLALFYMVLHEGLHADQDTVNEIVESSCPKFFSSCLPASTLLLLDFIYGCHAVAASTDLSGPRVEAQTILGSVLCFPNLYYDLPVLNPDSPEPQVILCNNIKEYVADALLTSAKKEPSAPARCVALSSLGVWLYEELTSPAEENGTTPSPVPAEGFAYAETDLSPVKGRMLARHGRVKEAINVLLVSLKFNNRMVAGVACSQLHLLIHCIPQLLEYMPEMPARIIEVMSLTASSLLQNYDTKSSPSGRQLLVSLLLCICDWCMSIPLTMLAETTAPGSDKRLIRTVFKALQTGALGKPGHSAKHSYSLSDLASKDFDPNLQIDKVQEWGQENSSSSVLGRNNKLALPPMPSVTLGTDNVVSLTASTVLSHLTNLLGHFPLAKGPAVLNSMVTEQQDHGSYEKNSSVDLSNELFNSPNVQFLIYNDTCLLSVVEISAQSDVPGGGPTAGLSTAPSDVRVIIRDTSGKFCWDSSILYGAPDIQAAMTPVRCSPLSTLDEEISKFITEHCDSYLSYAEAELARRQRVNNTPIPSYDTTLPVEQANDKLDQLLQYIGWSSPECQEIPGRPLNIPASVPVALEDSRLQVKAEEFIRKQHKTQSVSYSGNAHHTSCQSRPARPPAYSDPQSAFHQSRLLITECGFLSRENRRRISLLKKNERLLRELKNLDSRHCRETHKVAVLYIAPGQEDKLSVLSNTAGSEEFENFVSGLGWEIDLKTHCGFRGKLHSDGSTGETAPYYSTSTLEVVFHVSTRFPSTNEDSRNMKLKHLGNDEVHIVWSEHSRDYRRGIIPTEFGDVLIVIYPIRHRLYRIQIKKKEEVPYFGPLFDGAIVNARVLPVLVRETAINAGRAKRSQISLYQPFYEERAKYLRQIIDQFKEETTFEDYAGQLFSPTLGRSPSVKVHSKRPAPKPTPSPVNDPAPTPSSGNSTPSPIVGKVLPLSQHVLLANGNNNNNSDATEGHKYEHSARNTTVNGPDGPAHHTPAAHKEYSMEKFEGAKYTPGLQVVKEGVDVHPANPVPPATTSRLPTITGLISTPRPKPSAPPAPLSALHFSQPAQGYASTHLSSPRIHIPISKIQPSSPKATGNTSSFMFARKTSTGSIKSNASSTGVILVPPPPGARPAQGSGRPLSGSFTTAGNDTSFRNASR